MSSLRQITSDQAPAAIGPYSQALSQGGLIFVSGQLGLHTDKTMPEDIKEQAALAIGNVAHILEAAGSGLDKVLKSTVYLVDIDDFAAVNAVYAAFFKQPCPARSCVAVKALPLGGKVEIDVIATV